MAEIRPFRAWRYNGKLGHHIASLTSPLFDVVSDKQREVLYRNPYNSIHLSVPLGPQPAHRAVRLLESWKNDGTLVLDPLPALYVYYQYFKIPGQAKALCRKGFICHIRTYPWDARVILRHENTIPTSVNDRVELLEKTMLHASPTHGLYTDPGFVVEKIMDEAIQSPLYETEDYQGVRDVVAVIQDADRIRQIIDHLADKQIILADGHHRYESSLILQEKKSKDGASVTGKEGFHFHLMYLTNTASDDLRILPTHRLIRNMPDFSEEVLMSRLEKYFTVQPVEDRSSLPEIISGKPWAFGLMFRDNAFKIRLKESAFEHFHWPFPDEIKRLDLTVLHHYVIEKGLGIPGKDQRASQNIDFDRSFPECMAKVMRGDVQLAIITQEVSIEDVKRVCASGYTMPQKSTYFYPKVVCGFLFSSIAEPEFQLPVYSPF